MDPRMLEYYNRELQHLREVGGEFAGEFPKIAGRLGLDQFECADPYVERLLEGFAFLAARVQLKIDSEFPRMTQHLLEMVYPHYLSPMPSMAVVQFQPDRDEGSLNAGFTIPSGSVIRSRTAAGEQTACEYRTRGDVTLWPIEIIEAEYFTRDVASVPIPNVPKVKAGVRLKLQTTAGLKFSEIALDRLKIFLRGVGETVMRLYEQIHANTLAVAVRPGGAGPKSPWTNVLPASSIWPVGFRDEEALLPYSPQSFQGYRLLQEYFAFPQRYNFFELTGLGPSVRQCTGKELEILLLFDRVNTPLENAVDQGVFALSCTTAINLFPKRADRIHLTNKRSEHHVVPDRTRPLDLEVYSITGVSGFGANPVDEQFFRPFYSTDEIMSRSEASAYYTVHRQPRAMSARQQHRGLRTSYLGSEVFLSLVDSQEAPYRHELRQLAVNTLCTNRDLPLQIPLGLAKGDFTMVDSAPVDIIRCVAGPTRPRPSAITPRNETAWRVISHLSLNYLSLMDSDDHQGTRRFGNCSSFMRRPRSRPSKSKSKACASVRSRPCTRRIPHPGPIAFGRGQEISLTLDEAAFEGSGVYLLGAVCEQFFARYSSINSFTETRLFTTDRGEIAQWKPRSGLRQTL